MRTQSHGFRQNHRIGPIVGFGRNFGVKRFSGSRCVSHIRRIDTVSVVTERKRKIMAAAFSALVLWWMVALHFSCTSADQRNITAGETVTLPCRAAGGKPVSVIEWSRADLGDEFVLLYRDEQIDPLNQHPSFKNRVELLDPSMKDGNASLILKNATINDTGRYECRVRKEGSPETKLISSIRLNVSHPGHKDTGSQDGSSGLTVGLTLFLVVVVVVSGVVFISYRKRSACFRKKPPDPPVDL